MPSTPPYADLHLLHLVADTVTDVMALLDLHGSVLYASPAVRGLLGLEPNDLIGRKAEALCHRDDLKRLYRLAIKARRGKGARSVHRLRRFDGSYVWVETVLTPVPGADGQVTQFSSSTRDMTAHLEQEGVERHRQVMEMTLARIYARFIGAAHVEQAVDQALADMGQASGASRAYLFLFQAGGQHMDNTHEWCAPGVAAERDNLQGLPTDTFPWWMSRLRKGESIHIPDVSAMPTEAAAEREILESQCIKALLVYPVHSGGELAGFIGLDDVGVAQSWHSEIRSMLRIAAEIVGSAVLRERAEAELRQTKELFRCLIQNAMDQIITLSADLTIMYESPSVQRVLGYVPAEWVGRSVLDRMPVSDRAEAERFMQTLIRSPGSEWKGEATAYHADGTLLVMEMVCRNLLHDPTVAGLVVNYRDVTERKQFEARLLHQAYHDPLTGLPNRARFVDSLKQALERRAQTKAQVALLYLDLDGFKVVNDSLGHPAGDAVLIAVTRRLQAELANPNAIARMGGDEFVVLLEGVQGKDQAISTAERLIRSLNAPLSVDGRDLFVGTSVGIVVSTDDHTCDTLIRDADAALYRAKAKGRSCWDLFTPNLTVAAIKRLEMESELRRALLTNQFTLHYQPIVNMQSLQVSGIEALVRWTHPDLGAIPPDQFVPLAEETGLIAPLGDWVLNAACSMATSPSFQHAGVTISVNLSAREFHQPNLIERVQRALKSSGLPARRLQLEITETALMHDVSAARRSIEGLRQLGVKLALDDFGTGYSSLQHLRQFPVDTLKIDRSFIQHVTTRMEDRAIVESIITMAKALHMEVVAEGIESREQFAALHHVGCQQAQGYLLARPMPASEVQSLLLDHNGNAIEKGAAQE